MPYSLWKCSPTISPVSGTIPLIAEKIILSDSDSFSFDNSEVRKADGIAKISVSYFATILFKSSDNSNCFGLNSAD